MEKLDPFPPADPLAEALQFLRMNGAFYCRSELTAPWGIEVPALPVARRSLYLKLRDRESYEFALASVAVALRVDDGAVGEVRLALGGVATKPWRARRAEQLLVGEPATRESFARAAREELAPAVPQGMNAFKVELAQRAVVRALETVATMGGAA